jgi:CDP-paratose 2-epimerase
MTRPTGNAPILITGGCGFIGSNLADRLLRRGDDVIILDSLARSGVRENAQWLKSRHGGKVTISVGDVRDPISTIEAVRDARAVLHLAAQVAVTSSVDDPRTDFEVNAQGTLNVLEAVRLHNPSSTLLLASTNKVYGRLMQDSQLARSGARYSPTDAAFSTGVSEDAPLDFYSPYGCSKGTADQYVRDYARVFGLRTAVLRMSCIYGPRQYGNEDQGWIAHFMLAALHGEALTIFGDGCQVRDALHVDDAAAAWIAVMDQIDQLQGRVFNLGGGPANSVSLLELIGMIQDLTGVELRHSFAGWRPGDQPWYVSNTSSLSSATGWAPRVALPEGLRSLQQWLAGRFDNANGGREAFA